MKMPPVQRLGRTGPTVLAPLEFTIVPALVLTVVFESASVYETAMAGVEELVPALVVIVTVAPTL